ncbi:hypothetical protein GCM10010873_08650 [Cypionkella aquatica]|uniref:Uncharacterized protein n=1 Tax=Cypionkella aquatica TaxID=1756042 RepID=A0AA37TZR4_9RHOB|nr:hypothetical protein GCM10010873_08650 [Cypionkella aquatica]
MGVLADMPPLERGVVRLLRQWCDGEAGRIAVAEEFTAILGPEVAAIEVNHLAHLLSLMVQMGRRPLMRHHTACTCLGGDESAFAQMVAAATAGDREDAMAFALTMLPPDVAYEAVLTAGYVGRATLDIIHKLSAYPSIHGNSSAHPTTRH